MEKLTCTACSSPFTLTDADHQLYREKEVPAPTLCTDCRHQRRLLFRNEQFLYRRACSRCNKQFVSIYAEDKPYTVYCSDCFWSDSWDPMSFGKPFDYSRPFFDQMKELLERVPLLGNTVFNSTNCEYNAFCVDAKDCYMCTRVAAEGCMYCYLPIHSLDCVDCYNIVNCSYCYECTDCWNCYNARFSQLCRDSSDITFCYDCIGCRNCFGCVGLRNAEYHFFNEKLTKEEYERRVKAYDLSRHSVLTSVASHVHETLKQMPRRALYHMNSENASGDYIVESKNVEDSFDVEKSDTVRHSWGVEYAKDVVDGDFIYYGENCYNSISNSKSQNCDFCFAMLGGNFDCQYSMLLFNNAHDCFGSISIKKGAYTILNKLYEKDEYFKEKAKIIAHMKKEGSWGQFFPPMLSCFGYNEIPAQLYFPLTREEATQKGFKWYDAPEKSYQPSSVSMPDAMGDVSDSILEQSLSCARCGKNYRIVQKELAFYRQHGLPLPRDCHQCRHASRVALRNPRKIVDRTCAGCGQMMQTSYPTQSTAHVYCEKCYSTLVYGN